jgi:hypothetical protein
VYLYNGPFQARRLEAQLDDQMIAYRKLVSMKSDGSENDIEADIERSLKQLQQVNSQMQTWVSSGGSEVLSHTLTRHMEILQDLTQVHIASYSSTLSNCSLHNYSLFTYDVSQGSTNFSRVIIFWNHNILWINTF